MWRTRKSWRKTDGCPARGRDMKKAGCLCTIWYRAACLASVHSCCSVYTVCSMFQTNALTPTSLFRQSSLCTVWSSFSTWSSFTTVMTAEFISGHVCVPRRGSPPLVPRPCTCSKNVKPLILSWSSMYSTRSVLAWLNTINTAFIVLLFYFCGLSTVPLSSWGASCMNMYSFCSFMALSRSPWRDMMA